MKRIVVFLVVLLLLTAIVSCSRPSTPVAPPSVEPPKVQTEEPDKTKTPVSTSVLRLEAKWENMGLPASHSISRIIIDQKDEKIIYAAEQPGMAKEILWKFEEGKWLNVGEILAGWKGKVWIDNKERILTPEEMKTWKDGGEMLEQISGPAIPEGRDRYPSLEEQIYWNNFFNSKIISHQPGQINREALARLVIDGKIIFANIIIDEPYKDTVLRFVFSIDGGNSWYELSPKSESWSSTPELGVVSSSQEIRFYVGLGDGTVWQTTVQKVSLP